MGRRLRRASSRKFLAQYREDPQPARSGGNWKSTCGSGLRALPGPAAQRPGLRGDGRRQDRRRIRRDRCGNWSWPEVCGLAVSDAAEIFCVGSGRRGEPIIAAEALKEIRSRLQFLKNVGLEYLTLDRTAPTLSGGEMQRIRLAGQIGCGLVGVLYILDEPSIGLHPRDNDKLLETLAQLRDQGNTVVVVEHDEDTMRAADHIVDFGPGPGVRGGRVIAAAGPWRT